jgi:hypothetical protein
MRRLVLAFTVFLVLLKSARAELVVSSDHGFMIHFPFQSEKMSVKNPLGPLVSYGAVDEANSLILKLQAHKILKFVGNMQGTSTDQYKHLTKTNFDGYCKSSGAKNVKYKWTVVGKWPVVEFSCEFDGTMLEGVKSYMYGYHFLADDTFFKVSCHGVEKSPQLQKSAEELYATFGLLDSDTIQRGVERGVLKKE